MVKKKTAIIGAGNIGFKFGLIKNDFLTTHFQAYLDNPKTELVAVADLDRKLLNKVKKIFPCHTYTDYKKLLIKERPEIVSICTPDNAHYQILKNVAATPSVKGIWCEKPLAVSLSEAREMVRLCNKRKIKLAVNFIRRYDILYQQIKNNYLKTLGQIQVVSFYYSGGIINTGSHMLDLLCFLLGKCQEVSANFSSEGIVGRLRFGNVWVNIAPLSSKNYSIFEMNIFGSRARLDTINKRFGKYEYRYVVMETLKKIPGKFIAKKEKRPIKPDLPRRYMENALADLLQSISKDGNPISSGHTALQSVKIIQALFYSAKHQGKISIIN